MTVLLLFCFFLASLERRDKKKKNLSQNPCFTCTTWPIKLILIGIIFHCLLKHFVQLWLIVPFPDAEH